MMAVWTCKCDGRRRGPAALRAPSPPELGFTRVRHFKGSKSETSDFDWGEGWGEGVQDSVICNPHPDRHSASETRVNALMAIRPLPMGEVKPARTARKLQTWRRYTMPDIKIIN